MFVRQCPPILPAVVIDPVVLRDTLVEYLWRTFWALLVVLASIAAARAIRGAAVRALGRRRAHPNVIVLLGNLCQLVVLTLGVLVVLAIYTQGAFAWVLTSLSVLGVVVGLALVDILKNFFAGVYILVERPFRIGDTVTVGEHTGIVQDISFRTMRLRTADGREVIVPNASLMTAPVVNLTRYPSRSARLTVAVPGGEADGAAERLRDALTGHGEIAEDPAPVVLLRGVSDDTARYDVTVWGGDPDRARGDAIEAIRRTGAGWDVQGD